jgi:hypothetical protein
MATHRVVARVDVDGDGRTDVVRLRKVEDQHAVLTVSTARGATLSRHLRTTWIDPMWHGAARIDGRPGAELVLITDAGAHTLFHTVLTFATDDWSGSSARALGVPGSRTAPPSSTSAGSGTARMGGHSSPSGG